MSSMLGEREFEKGIDIGRRAGLSEGLNKGERNATRKIAQAMLTMGADVTFIAKTTGLTLAEIETLT